ncbi:ABC transporter ATP-binding protein [Fusobacterium necrophorum]|nr:ABC transporter ATP-binding protein [Fusobacterium necrophorum]MDK4485876.1 ABC transporter ATP-binding protein [Fusobacterium necrophorum]
MEEILRVENLSVRYYAASGKRQTGIQNINFSLQEGEIYGIIGESGSGKSTLLLAILGLLEDKAEIKGKIFYRGKEIQNLSEKEKKKIRFEEIAVVFQNQLDRLNPSLTVEEQILEIIRKKFQKKEEQEKRLLELFQMLHLDVSLRKKYPHQLSGGMRQRVFIAMGLALKPKILLIDEPTTALDPELKQQILELFQKIYKEYGMTMLIVSHDLEVIEKLSQKMLVFLRGSLLERGNTTNILEEARHPYTAALLQSSPYLNEWKDLWGIVEEEERHSCPFYERCTQKVKECLQYIPNLKVEEEEGVA